MSNVHQDKYISKLLLGFTFVILGVFVIMYAAFERARTDDWYIWGVIASVLICAGLYFLLASFVHKMKSDLIRRQKQRDQIKTFPSSSSDI